MHFTGKWLTRDGSVVVVVRQNYIKVIEFKESPLRIKNEYSIDVIGNCSENPNLDLIERVEGKHEGYE